MSSARTRILFIPSRRRISTGCRRRAGNSATGTSGISPKRRCANHVAAKRQNAARCFRDGANKWSLAPGSQGIIDPPAIEETAHRLGELTAAGWVGRNITEPEKFGFKPDNLQVIVELKNGEKLSVDFGTPISNQTALAAVTLDGERWAFVFPPVLYQFVVTYLTIPANIP